MDERDPVADDELVFRRIPPAYFDGSLEIPVQREAFRPTEKDTTGLSVFRCKFAQPEDALANVDAAKKSGYRVARLAVRDLNALGLSAIPDPMSGGPPGHAVIPELSWPAYQADRTRLKAIGLALAKLASADIVPTS